MYLSRTPAAHLSTWVDCPWANERGALAHAREHMLPSGCHQVVIALHEGSLLRFESEADRRGHRFGSAVWQGAHDAPAPRDTPAPSSVVGIAPSWR